MIVECPECSTQFNLPADRVTTRGSKVRCSKCSKTFRVRLSADGSAEVFQKSEGVADPPTQDLADLFDESFAEELDFAMQSTQFSAPGGGTQEVDPRRTMIGLPASNRDEPRSKSAAPDYNPFPFAALDEPKSHTPMPKRASSPTPMPQRKTAPTPAGIDLFDGEDPALTASSTVMLDDPFSEIFDEPAPPAPAAKSNELLSPSLPKLGRAAPQAAAPAPRPEPVLKKPLVSALPVDDVPDEAEILGNQASDFGPAEDMVDPSFGQDTYFDPDAGHPAAPPVATAPPRAAAAARPAPAPQAAPKAALQPRPAAMDDELDLAPHRIGGGGFQKFVNFLLILILAVVSVLGYIAARTGGILDFGQFDNMMEILVEGKAYEPRAEWTKPAPAPLPPEPVNPLSAQNVFARMLPVGKKDSVLIVTGEVANAASAASEPVKVRVMLLDDQQKVLGEVNTMTGRTIDINAIGDAKNVEDVASLKPGAPAGVKANGSEGFTAVFADPPARARENKDFQVRVELR